jgi:hypothetical protein
MSEKIPASPTKEYFINMMTKDVSIEDSILDLIDNGLDGARRQIGREKGQAAILEPSYEGYHVQINFNNSHFSIEDNCGGIALEAAKNSVFYFGRKADAPRETNYSLGVFGIGMKRAFFKLGKNIRIQSSTKTEAFSVDIDVNRWTENGQWDLELQREPVWDTPGTRIEITNLHKNVSREFDTDPVFTNILKKIIARDYSFLLHDGFKIIVNSNPVKPYEFKLRESNEFRPLNDHSQNPELPEVSVKIIAGLSEFPPDDPYSDEVREPWLNAPDYFGWYVVCNGRIVLAADKSEKTVWGNSITSPKWHAQYNGFIGIVSFYSPDPVHLPWTTTRRDLDLTNGVYRRATSTMKDATWRYIRYTNKRKEDLEGAKELEKKALPKPIGQLPEHTPLTLPRLTNSPRRKMAEIKYYQPKDLIDKVKEDIGRSFITNNELGVYSFEYFLDNEVSLD